MPAVLLNIVVTAVVCTTIDFTCGMICNQNYEVWDYRALPFYQLLLQSLQAGRGILEPGWKGAYAAGIDEGEA